MKILKVKGYEDRDLDILDSLEYGLNAISSNDPAYGTSFTGSVSEPLLSLPRSVVFRSYNPFKIIYNYRKETTVLLFRRFGEGTICPTKIKTKEGDHMNLELGYMIGMIKHYQPEKLILLKKLADKGSQFFDNIVVVFNMFLKDRGYTDREILEINELEGKEFLDYFEVEIEVIT